MTTYRYTDETNTVVHVIDDDGISRMSMLASALPPETEVLPFVPPPQPVPQFVSRAQGKAALISAGHWPTVLAFVDSIGDPLQKALAEVALNDTLEWRRDSAFLNACVAAISLSQNDLDALFLSASEIQF